jgi:hypothetical protein
MADNLRVGTVTGTGAAVNISLGWIPDFVIIFNATDGDVVDFWANGMTALTSVLINTAAATRAASDGISTYTGATTAAKGFTIGAGISESAKVLYYLACRNTP